jgi:hypothetical protein
MNFNDLYLLLGQPLEWQDINKYARFFLLEKKEFADLVYLWTDGKTIVLSDSAIPNNPILESNCETMRYVDPDKFDGIEFSKILLDYIHRKIYSRVASYEQRIFESPGNLEDIRKIIKND